MRGVPQGPKGERRPADVIGAAVVAMKIATEEIAEPIEPQTVIATKIAMDEVAERIDAKKNTAAVESGNLRYRARSQEIWEHNVVMLARLRRAQNKNGGSRKKHPWDTG